MDLQLPIAREMWLKLSRKLDEGLDGCLKPATDFVAMPNQRSKDKVVLSFYIPRALSHRLRKLAKLRKQTLTSLIESLISDAVSDIELSAEDYEKIAQEIRDYERASLKRSKGKA